MHFGGPKAHRYFDSRLNFLTRLLTPLSVLSARFAPYFLPCKSFWRVQLKADRFATFTSDVGQFAGRQLSFAQK